MDKDETFLFEKSLIGTCCNRLNDLGERHGHILGYGRIKANSACKNLIVTNTNVKAGPPNCQIGPPLNSLFISLLSK